MGSALGLVFVVLLRFLWEAFSAVVGEQTADAVFWGAVLAAVGIWLVKRIRSE